MSLERGTNLEVLPVENAPTLTIGSVTTLAAGNAATVTNVGSPQNALLNFGIPRGADAANPNLAVAANGLAAGNAPTVGLTGTYPNLTLTFGIPAGANGVSPNLTIGTVTTLSSGSSATASLTGSFPNLSLNLGIPMGATGSGSTVAWGGITGTLSSQTDLNTALSGKASTSHTHAESDVTGLVAGLAAKADTVHSHAIADVTGLQAALDAKASLASAPLTGAPTLNGSLIGYRNLPTSRSISANDTLADGDKGKKLVWTGGVGTLTLDPNGTTPIDSDAIGTIVNDGSGNLTVVRGASVVAKLIGTGVNADRVVPPGCVATWFKTGANSFYFGGANVT